MPFNGAIFTLGIDARPHPMAAKTFLAGDLGGTKTLLALYSETDRGLNKEFSHRYASAEWSDLESMLGDFLKTLPPGVSKPETSCIAVASMIRSSHSISG